MSTSGISKKTNIVQLCLLHWFSNLCRKMSNFRHPAQRIPNELHGHFISVRYKGCADRWRWRGLDISYQGCRYQDYLGWNNRRTLWCFCDYEFCNRVRETDFNDARFTKKGDSIQQDSKGQGGSREKDSYKNCGSCTAELELEFEFLSHLQQGNWRWLFPSTNLHMSTNNRKFGHLQQGIGDGLHLNSVRELKLYLV